MEKIKCPICDSQKINQYFEKDGYKLYKCFDCELVFVYPIPDSLDEIYSKNYFYKNEGKESFGYTDYEKDKKPLEKFYSSILQEIESLVDGRSIFDVGAATGFFLDIAKKRGWKTSGSEISKFAGSEARSKGHDVHISEIREIDANSNYSAVTMWDVFEHVSDPNEYVEVSYNFLDAGGILLINTIDIKSWCAKVLGKRWHAILPPEHIFYYSKGNLRYILEKNNFEILDIKKIGKKFSLSYIFQVAYNWQRMKIFKSLSDFFDKKFWRFFSIPLNLRDNILVIARKK